MYKKIVIISFFSILSLCSASEYTSNNQKDPIQQKVKEQQGKILNRLKQLQSDSTPSVNLEKIKISSNFSLITASNIKSSHDPDKTRKELFGVSLTINK